MLQISFDIVTLTNPQREALAGFILSFPTATTEVAETPEGCNVVTIPPFTFESEPTPEAVFGRTETVPVEPKSPSLALVEEMITDRLDKDGLPWDDRIHSSSKAKTVDGRWRKKRNLDDAQAATVEAELKALMGLPGPITEVAEVVKPSYTSESMLPPPPPATPVPPPPPSAPTVAGDRQGFIELITSTAAAITANRMTQEELTAIITAAGVPSLALLANRFDLVPHVAAKVAELLNGRAA